MATSQTGPNSECELLSATPTSLAVPEMVASPDWSFYVVNVPTGVSHDSVYGLYQREVRCGIF